jgi:hypothetical protein
VWNAPVPQEVLSFMLDAAQEDSGELQAPSLIVADS